MKNLRTDWSYVVPTVFAIRTVDNPLSARDCWGIFADSRRVFGPANVYDCVLARARFVRDERCHEHRFQYPNVRELRS